ncbi:MAG TPA: TIGR02587 family membrane protein [Thermoanaerobaculia bacterium]
MTDAADAGSRHAIPSTADSLREYGRGFAGGLLFSLPLLYTMEVWWVSFIAQPSRLLVLLAFTFLLLLGYNRYAGLRHDASWGEVAIDSVEELGLGIGTSAVVLYLIGRIGPATSSAEALGKVVVEAAIVAVGFSVGSAQLGSRDRDRGKGSEDDEGRPTLARQVVIAGCGAVLFAANVAPTEEILMIAAETGPVRLLGLAALSLVVAGGVLYSMDFKGAERFAAVEGKLDVAIGLAMTYAIALAVSAILLWFFGRFDGVGPDVCARQVVVLGFPAALGSAAGRLLLQS